MAFKLKGHSLPGPNQKKNSALPKTSPFLDTGHGGKKWQKMNKGHDHDFETNKFRVEDDERSIHLKNEDYGDATRTLRISGKITMTKPQTRPRALKKHLPHNTI